MKNEIVFLNNNKIPKKLISGKLASQANIRKLPIKLIRQYEEILPSGLSYKVRETSKQAQFDNTGLFKIPAKHYFVLGDNRDNSWDSRADTALRFIPYDNIRGKLITRNPFLQFITNLVKVIEL